MPTVEADRSPLPRRLLKKPAYATLLSIFGRSQGAKRGRSCGATDKLGDIARAKIGEQPGGREPLWALSRRSSVTAPSRGCSLVPSTNICPKDLTRDMRGFFNSLLEGQLNHRSPPSKSHELSHTDARTQSPVGRF